ncbi:AraC family transcriptional regulator [Chryseolinea soli]|uniref:AraC family transcriptional regulator n=1 Tax=Chryseolinea soli TaxID=2321403 RepID=A0A385SII7_9BACT|nr:AraC family transcriptional regulator [Chryseolinea soli]AYB29180.1 AraC family transcriptional regulator [Chryseolinea soli]
MDYSIFMAKMQAIRKREGFEGQRAIVLPKKILEVCGYTLPINSLYLTDIGFYPRAQFHYRERPSGISAHILIYCLEGKGWVELPSGNVNINPNEVLIIPAEMPHKYGADDKNPWTIYWAHFKGLQSAYFVNLLTKQFKSFVNDNIFLEERIKIFDMIYRNLESGYSLDNLFFASTSFQYFLTTLTFSDKFASAQHAVEKDVVDLSIEYMQDHLDTPIKLEALAASVNLSLSHYSNIFKRKTGYSPIIYFNHLKIQHACQYLQFTSLRINEISSKLGIEDPYYFSRLFTKVMGLSPVEYRHKKR